jgi:hypothetical protein
VDDVLAAAEYLSKLEYVDPMTVDALVMPVGSTALIGQMQLEALDLVVDAKSRTVAVNAASPDMPLLDLLRVS